MVLLLMQAGTLNAQTESEVRMQWRDTEHTSPILIDLIPGKLKLGFLFTTLNPRMALSPAGPTLPTGCGR